MEGIQINIVNEDALQLAGDILLLKYAQKPHGLDRKVIQALKQDGHVLDQLPTADEVLLFEQQSVAAARRILFIGVEELQQFRYREIREFSRESLSRLQALEESFSTIILTLHGANYGLDEEEAFESLLAGLIDGVKEGEYPPDLEQIIIAELNSKRAARLQEQLAVLLPSQVIPTRGQGLMRGMDHASKKRLRSVGYTSDHKRSIFVAMPFADAFDDIFHYGIQGAVKSAGFLCERADLEAFTGDIMAWVRERITKAEYVVAELTGANANVYLEVGYAWGVGIPVILIIHQDDKVKFDVRGHRYLKYSSIRDLEEKLKTELLRLSAS
ncbi:MAG: hypothetical protein AAFP19_04800 [Bacteroidota bacterium]